MPVNLRHRLTFIVIVLVVATALAVVRLFDVQIVQGRALRERAETELTAKIVLPEPPRGLIYDRDGFLLAINEPRYAIEASALYVSDPAQSAQTLAPVIYEPAEALSSAIATALQSTPPWVCLKQDATREEADQVSDLHLEGITARLWWLRRYPHGPVAAQVLGFVSRGGEGFYGLEGYYDSLLRPLTPEWTGEVSPTGPHPLPPVEGQVPPPRAGTDLRLTLDLAVQAVVEEELARALQEFGAEAGTVIVTDARTGAILALASQPGFDPNRYEDYVQQGQQRLFLNPAIGAPYEPGSVFKIVTVAAALDSGVATPQTTYIDTGRIEVGGRVYTNWDNQAYGERGLADLLGYSLNVGAVHLALQMGPDTFYRYVRRFGFEQLTGVDLEGEVRGQVHVPGDLDWHDSDLGANAFGQGLAVTPLQMVSAVAAVANEGRIMRPYLVAQQVLPDGTVIESRPVVRGQPITPQTAQALTEILAQALERHMPQAAVPGYRVAGKTGTAQIPIPGGYDPRWTIATFVGFGPVRARLDPDLPLLTILVRLDRPQTSPWSSETAALVFQRLASRLFPMLAIPPD